MSDTERVSARVRVKMLMRGLVGSTGGYPTHAEIDEALDAHERAVRAEERARLVAELAERFDAAAKRSAQDGYHESAECYTVARNLTLAALTGSDK